jgi:hypothetical protein
MFNFHFHYLDPSHLSSLINAKPKRSACTPPPVVSANTPKRISTPHGTSRSSIRSAFIACYWQGAAGLPQTAIHGLETVPFKWVEKADGCVFANLELSVPLKHPADLSWEQLPPLRVHLFVYDSDTPPPSIMASDEPLYVFELPLAEAIEKRSVTRSMTGLLVAGCRCRMCFCFHVSCVHVCVCMCVCVRARARVYLSVYVRVWVSMLRVLCVGY